MKIAVLATKFPRFRDDHEPRFVYDISKEIEKMGHEVHVIAPHHHGSKRYEDFDGLHVHRFRYFFPEKYQRLCYGAGIPENIKNSKLARLQIPFFSLSAIINVKRILDKIRPDVIHSHWTFPLSIGAMLHGKAPFIITVYGGELFIFKRFRMMKILDHIISKSYKTFALTDGLRNLMVESGIKDGNVSVMPLGFDDSIFSPGKIQPESNNILTVCRLVEKKGIEYLIKAFAETLKEFPKTRLQIVGSGPLESMLKGLASELGIEGSVDFIGPVDHSKLPSYYKSAYVFAMPSIIDSKGDRETQGVVFLEAMGCGIPVIGTNTGGIPNIVVDGKTGILVEQKDYKALSEGMIKLLKDKELRNQYSRNAHKHSLNYTWKQIANKYVNIYRKSLS